MTSGLTVCGSCDKTYASRQLYEDHRVNCLILLREKEKNERRFFSW